MADVAVSGALALFDKLESFLSQEINLQKNVHDGVEYIRKRLRTMQAYLRDMEGKERSEGQKDRVKQVRDVAYDIEDILDEFMLHDMPRQFHRHKSLFEKAREKVHAVKHRNPLSEISSEIEEIKTKIDNIKDSDALRAGGNTISEEDVEFEVNHHIPEEDEMVGFEKPREKLIRHLFKEESRRVTTWVVGPGGSGKTILVRNVYKSRRVRGQFDCHAWVTVTRSCKMEGTLRSMLMQFCMGKEELYPHGAEDIPAKLRCYLQEKRYIVVLDNIWSQNDWLCIENVLPKRSGNGSRIIVTTRNDVASFSVEWPYHIYKLNGLPWHAAWDLFSKKAFQTSNCGKCPPELEEWSQNIVKWCEGSPQAIVAVGNLLSMKRKSPIELGNVYASLRSEIGTNSNLSVIRSILLPSYRDLPSNLKSCFLYFSILPEGYSIKRGRLIRLWVAEGFVKKTSVKTLEEVAEDYLNELIGRNLVQANGKDFDGRIRSCRVLNLVREFIITKSEEENFVKIFTEPITRSSEIIRRLSIHNIACPNLSSPAPLK